MNQTNKLLNKIKDNKIKESDKDVEEKTKITKSHLTEENLDEYLATIETDEYSKQLLNRYLEKKTKK